MDSSRNGKHRQDDRKARLAAALRENLKRRKAQARGKAQEPEAGGSAAAPGDEQTDADQPPPRS